MPVVGEFFDSWGDYCNYNASGVVLHVGGNYGQNQNHGLFYLNGNNAASNKNANIGARILIWIDISFFVTIDLRLAAIVMGIDFAYLLVAIMSKKAWFSTLKRAWERS